MANKTALHREGPDLVARAGDDVPLNRLRPLASIAVPAVRDGALELRLTPAHRSTAGRRRVIAAVNAAVDPLARMLVSVGAVAVLVAGCNGAKRVGSTPPAGVEKVADAAPVATARPAPDEAQCAAALVEVAGEEGPPASVLQIQALGGVPARAVCAGRADQAGAVTLTLAPVVLRDGAWVGSGESRHFGYERNEDPDAAEPADESGTLVLAALALAEAAGAADALRADFTVESNEGEVAITDTVLYRVDDRGLLEMLSLGQRREVGEVDEVRDATLTIAPTATSGYRDLQVDWHLSYEDHGNDEVEPYDRHETERYVWVGTAYQKR